MVNVVVVREQDLRVADLARVELRIRNSGEVDVYRDMNADPMPFEVHIRLHRPERGRLDGSLSFGENSLKVLPIVPGCEIRVLGEDGRFLDAEMTEVVIWELIEDLDTAVGYFYGRDPHRHSNGAPARPGEIIRMRDSEPEPEFSI